jgi:hypothetical protein
MCSSKESPSDLINPPDYQLGHHIAASAIVLVSPAPTLVADAPKSLKEAVGAPLAEFFTRPHAWGFLAVIILYKLRDAFASTLQTVLSNVLLRSCPHANGIMQKLLHIRRGREEDRQTGLVGQPSV